MSRPIPTFFGVATGLGGLATGTYHRERRAEAEWSSKGDGRGGRERDSAAVCSPLTIRIHHDTFVILRAYVDAAPGELTLLGTAEIDSVQHEIRVDRLFLPAQTSSDGHTEVGEEALAQLLVDAVTQGVDTTCLRVWLHSHGRAEAFFSTVDEACIQGAFPQADWVLSLVTNRAGQIKARLSLYRPFRLDVDELPVAVGLPFELEQAIRQEVEQKVRRGYDR